MSVVQVQSLIEAGVHFGHRVSRWHPKMKPFIFGKRNLIHIIDIRETIRGLVRASNFLTQLSAMGKDVVFIGTKRQAKSLIQREAQRCGMHFVSERWLGGTLTNYHTIRARLRRLEELESLEQTGEIEKYSKKRISSLRRERRKITRNLEGIRNMKQLPGCLLVVDIRKEYISVREAKKLGIPVVGLVDTDCDPGNVDIAIPGNDDAYRAIQQVLRILTDSIIAGRDKYVTVQAELEKARLEEEARARAEEAAQKKALAAQQAEKARASGEPAGQGAPGAS
ncbi:MAG TPA: 30S ribosomal protein S2 [Planctomycetota bacterium]|nr:30S ribosomal protein S2 [Planctomycetota bacterium]